MKLSVTVPRYSVTRAPGTYARGDKTTEVGSTGTGLRDPRRPTLPCRPKLVELGRPRPGLYPSLGRTSLPFPSLDDRNFADSSLWDVKSFVPIKGASDSFPTAAGAERSLGVVRKAGRSDWMLCDAPSSTGRVPRSGASLCRPEDSRESWQPLGLRERTDRKGGLKRLPSDALCSCIFCAVAEDMADTMYGGTRHGEASVSFHDVITATPASKSARGCSRMLSSMDSRLFSLPSRSPGTAASAVSASFSRLPSASRGIGGASSCTTLPWATSSSTSSSLIFPRNASPRMAEGLAGAPDMIILVSASLKLLSTKAANLFGFCAVEPLGMLLYSP
eukprot:scaffold1397_cov254-Pinguiococcus_pyrenoidosus.AAC.38